MSELIESYVDGVASATVPIEDRGLAYGHGVFETMRVHHGVVVDLPLHLLRLSKSMHALRLGQLNLDKLTVLLSDIGQKHKSCVVKFLVTNGDGKRGYQAVANVRRELCLVYPVPSWPDSFYTQGVKVTVCQTRLAQQPLLGGIKHLNRLEQVLARSEWSRDDFQEGLMLDQSDHVIEGTMSNLFFISRGILRTPRLDDCGVAGVKRQRVVQTAKQLGMATEFSEVTVAEVLQSDEVFLTNSVVGLWPVAKILDTEFQLGQSTRRLAQAVNIWRS